MYNFSISDQRQANASLVAHLPPSSPTNPVFDHPIIGIDQQTGNAPPSPKGLPEVDKKSEKEERKSQTNNPNQANNLSKKPPHAPQNSKFIRKLFGT